MTTVGVRDKTGWAVLVTLDGAAREPEVVDRRRVELCPADLPRQPYHAAQGLPLDEAATLVEDVTAAAARLAADAFRGVEATAVAVPVSGMTVPDDLAAILGSHTLLHAAEGVLYRDALLDGAQACGCHVVGVDVKRLVPELAVRLVRSADDVRATLQAMGKELGPPWRAEHKEAAAAAWLAMFG